MNTLARRAFTTTAALAAVAGTGLCIAPTAQAASSPFVAPTGFRVTASWAVVETSTITNTTGNTSLVYAVHSSGSQQPLLRLPHGDQVTAVSGDGRRVAVVGGPQKNPHTTIYDLSTRQVTTFPHTVVRFTNPAGTNVYVNPGNTSNAPMVKTDLRGHVTARYPGITESAVVPTPDGVMVWGSTKGHITLNNNATGAVLRTVAAPRGYDRCMPTHAWGTTSVVGWCQAANNGPSQDFLFHANGTTTPLTSSLPKSSNGWVDAWETANGLMGQQASGCLPAQPQLKVGNHLLGVPVEGVVGADAQTVLGLTSAGCDTKIPTFVRVDLPTMKVHNLLTPAKGRTITSAVTNDPIA